MEPQVGIGAKILKVTYIQTVGGGSRAGRRSLGKEREVVRCEGQQRGTERARGERMREREACVDLIVVMGHGERRIFAREQ